MAVIELLVPGLAASLAGNTVTATRYHSIFTELGHDVRTTPAPTDEAEVVVALNAYRSAAGIAQVAPQVPVIVVLTGTDVYRFLAEHPDEVTASLDRADHLVGLNDRIGDAVESRHQPKLTVIKEGATRPTSSPTADPVDPVDPAVFEVAVVGHLRDEKDPKVVVEALRLLPDASPVQVRHYGEAHNEQWADWATAESASSPRYQWCHQVPRNKIDEVYGASRLLVNSSIMEGGANVLSEAIMAGLAVLASDIAGNVGVLGEHYPGYFPVGDAPALATALNELATSSDRLAHLGDAITTLQPAFTVEVEREGWDHLFSRLGLA